MARKQISFKFKLLFICVLFFFLGLFFVLLTSFVAKKFFPAAKTPLSNVSEKLVNPIKRLLGKNPHPPILIQNRALLSPRPVTVKINDKPLGDIIASFHLMSSPRLLLFSNQKLTQNLTSLSFEITDLPQKRLAVWSANQKLIAFDQVLDEKTNSVKLMVYLNPDYLATLDLQAQEDLINREIYRGLFFMANWENFQESGRVFEPETIPDLKFVELSKPVSLFKKILGNFEVAAYCDHGPECGWNRKDCTCDKDGSACSYDYQDCGYSKPYEKCVCTDYYCHPNGTLGHCSGAFGYCIDSNCGADGDCPPFFSCQWIPDYVPPNPSLTPLPTSGPVPVPTNFWRCGVTFGVRNTAIVYVFEDVNANGVWEDGEPQIDVNASSGTAFLAANPRAAEAATTNTHLRKS
jgi:hypothetical protein